MHFYWSCLHKILVVSWLVWLFVMLYELCSFWHVESYDEYEHRMRSYWEITEMNSWMWCLSYGPLPWWVRSHGRSKDLNKNIIFCLGGRWYGVLPDSPFCVRPPFPLLPLFFCPRPVLCWKISILVWQLREGLVRQLDNQHTSFLYSPNPFNQTRSV